MNRVNGRARNGTTHRRGRSVRAPRRSQWLRPVVLASIICCASLAPASIVAQAAPAADTTDFWAATVDFALSAASGNERFIIATTGGELKRLETDRFELELDARARYGRSRGRDVARTARAGIKFDFAPEARWSPFLLARAEHDRLRELELRAQGGAGAKYTFWREDAGDASISLAGIYDREALREQPAAATARWSWRFKMERELGSIVRLRQTTFYQPEWDELSDYLLTTLTSLDTALSDRLALTFSHEYERDATPPEGVRSNDQIVNVGLKIEF